MWTRRKRKPAVSWLPVIGSTTGPQPAATVVPIDSNLAVAGDGSVSTNVHPLTWDVPAEQALAAAENVSLADFENSAYRLRRIVGKFFCAMRQTTEAMVNRPELGMVTAGFIVLKVDEITGTPVAGSSGPYSPWLAENVRDPWIWRRSWALSDNFAQPALESPSSNYPQTNAEYGSAVDGPHIDTKIGRVIQNDERLYFVVSTYSPTPHNAENGLIDYVLDYRILASMRKATNRRNASR